MNKQTNKRSAAIKAALEKDKKVLDEFDFEWLYIIDPDADLKSRLQTRKSTRGSRQVSVYKKDKLNYDEYISKEVKVRGTTIRGLALEYVYAYMSRNRSLSLRQSVADLIAKGFQKYRTELLSSNIVHLLAEDMPLTELIDQLSHSRPLKLTIKEIMLDLIEEQKNKDGKSE